MRFNYKFENKKGMESYKYERGKIYKIYSKIGDVTYYGSTIQTLKERFRCHKKDIKMGKYHKSRDVLKYNDSVIILVEKYPCNNKKELLNREGYYQLNFKCVNYKIAGRTKKQYYNDHKEEICKKGKIKTTCCCGSVVRAFGIRRHEKTVKHKNYINSLKVINV